MFGDESINEVICSRFLQKIGFNCVKYTLVYAKVKINGIIYNTYVCKSENFFKGFSSRITLENLHTLYNCTTDELIDRLGIANQVRLMILADFLVLQRDRHGGNIELLEKGDNYILSPLFDNGLGLLAPYPSSFVNNIDIIKRFDVLHDYPVNNYIGTRSLYQNLSYIKNPIEVKRLVKDDKQGLFYGLHSVLPKEYIDKIWELLTYRYMYLRKKGFITEHD